MNCSDGCGFSVYRGPIRVRVMGVLRHYQQYSSYPVILWRSVLLETTDLPKVSDQLYHIMLYRVHLGGNSVTMADQIRDMWVRWFGLWY